MLKKDILLFLDRYMLIALAFCIPLQKQLIPFIIALILLRWLLGGQFLQIPVAIKRSKRGTYLSLFSVFYLIHIIGLINTDNFTAGLFDLEVKASLLIFPLIMLTMNCACLEGKWLMRVLAAFVAGNMVSMFFSLGHAIWMWQQTGDPLNFFYSKLSYFHHPSYMALYLNFAIAICLYMLFELRQELWRHGIWLSIFSIFLFMWFIVMLSSKAGILGLIMLLFMGMIYLIIKQKYIVQGVVGFLISIAFFFIMINLFPYSAMRIKAATATLEDSHRWQDDESEGTADRLLIWRAGVSLAWENFLTGAGTGDVKDVLTAEYDRLGMKAASEKRLNAHNQYLQTAIALGVIGLLMLILSLFLPMLEAYRMRNFLYFLFLVLFGFNLLVESMLETQAGVVFYAYFNALFFANKKLQQQSPSKG